MQNVKCSDFYFYVNRYRWFESMSKLTKACKIGYARSILKEGHLIIVYLII